MKAPVAPSAAPKQPLISNPRFQFRYPLPNSRINSRISKNNFPIHRRHRLLLHHLHHCRRRLNRTTSAIKIETFRWIGRTRRRPSTPTACGTTSCRSWRRKWWRRSSTAAESEAATLPPPPGSIFSATAFPTTSTTSLPVMAAASLPHLLHRQANADSAGINNRRRAGEPVLPTTTPPSLRRKLISSGL